MREITPTEKALLAALEDAWAMLHDSRVKWKICDGGRGNLGNTHLYTAAQTSYRLAKAELAKERA